MKLKSQNGGGLGSHDPESGGFTVDGVMVWTWFIVISREMGLF
jgi:hypothetical protein